MADEELRAKVTLDATQFSVGVGEIVSKLSALEGAIGAVGSKLENNLDKSLGQVNQSLQGLSLDSVAAKLTSVGNSLKGALGEVVTPAVDFQAAMAQVNTIARLSAPELAKLSEQMRTLSADMGVGVQPTEAAAAAYDILSAGFTNAADSTTILKEAVVASRAGMISTAEAADVLTSALNAYGQGADQAKRFNDVLAQGVLDGKIEYADFAQSLGAVAPAAAANKVSIEELTATLAALTASGLQPARAVTALNAAIVQLGAPTEEARKAAAGLGIDLESAGFRGLGLTNKLQVLAQAAGKNQSALRQVLGDVNALGVAFSLAGPAGEKYAASIERMNGPLNTSRESLEANQGTVKASQERFEAAAAALKIAISDQLLPAMTGFVDVGTKGIQFFDSFSPLAKGAAGIAFGLTTAVTLAGGAIVTLAGTIRLAAVAMGVQLPAASVAAQAAFARISAGALAARASILAMNAAALAGPLGLLLLGAGAIKAAMDFAELKDSAVAAADAIETVGAKALPGGSKQTASTGAILATPVADLKKQGIDQTDVQNRIRELRETREDALAAGDKALVAKLDDKIRQLIAVREKLDAPAKPGSPAAAKDPVADFLKNRKAPVDPEAEKERKKQALFEIEHSKLAGEERIKALEAFIVKEKLAGDERRKIEQEIFQIREKLASEASAKAKKAADDAKADALQEIDLSKASHAQKIQQLSALATKYKEDADLRRTINRQIAQEEEAAAKDRADRQKKRQEDAKKAQEDAKEASSEVRGAQQDAVGLRQDAISSEIEKAKEKGGPGAVSAVSALLNERQKLTEETIRLQLAEQLATTQSAEAKVQLERNAEERIRQERAKTADELKALQKQQLEETKRNLDAIENVGKKPSTEFTGQLLSVEEMAKQSQARFGSEAVNSNFGARQAATTAARAKTLASNLAAMQLSPQTLKNVTATSAPSPQITLAPLQIAITLTDQAGNVETRRVTIPGVPGPAQGGHGSVSFSPRGRA